MKNGGPMRTDNFNGS